MGAHSAGQHRTESQFSSTGGTKSRDPNNNWPSLCVSPAANDVNKVTVYSIATTSVAVLTLEAGLCQCEKHSQFIMTGPEKKMAPAAPYGSAILLVGVKARTKSSINRIVYNEATTKLAAFIGGKYLGF